MINFRSTRFWKNYLQYKKNSGDSSMRGFVDGLLFWKILNTLPKNIRILEIGSYQGLTTGLFFDCIPDATIISVDIVDRLDLFRSNYKDHLDQHQFVLSSSQTFIPQDSYDVIFIDGDHNYHPCLSDIKLSFKHLRPDSLLILDDYTMPGVAEAIQDLYNMNNDWVPFIQGIQTQFWHHKSQNKEIFLNNLLMDPIANFILMKNTKDHQNNVILQAECVRMLTDNYEIFDKALNMYNV